MTVYHKLLVKAPSNSSELAFKALIIDLVLLILKDSTRPKYGTRAALSQSFSSALGLEHLLSAEESNGVARISWRQRKATFHLVMYGIQSKECIERG